MHNNSTQHNVNFHPMLNIAIKAIRKAGSIINKASLDIANVASSKKDDGSLVSEIDKNVQDEILDILQYVYPEHQYIAEEGDAAQMDPSKEYTWYIDPIDGTSNFIHGFDYYAVSIAVARGKQIEHAAIYNPNNDELFCASRGKGAFLNNRRIRVSHRIKLSEALVATSFLHKRNITQAQDVQTYLGTMQDVAGIRRTGSIALDLAYVSCGRLDAFFDQNLYTWDIAAGMLLIREAGGLIGDFSGDSHNDVDLMASKQLLAANPKIFSGLVTSLNKFNK
jgi:myo-inositol-1(or 4)-monophosphatase